MLTSGHVRPPRQRPTILGVEDAFQARRLLHRHLEPLGYHVITVGEAQRVAHAITVHDPDLVVLGLNLPDGFDVCQQIRTTSTVPIILLSASSLPTDTVRGLTLGADDYITKPYVPAELAARIEAVLRRVRCAHVQRQSRFHCGPLTIDFEQRRVTVNGSEVCLTRTEYRLLEYLARNAGRVLVADALLANVWGTEYMADYASLHLYINRLRRKLGENGRNARLIRTRPGIGYLMPTLGTSAPGPGTP